MKKIWVLWLGLALYACQNNASSSEKTLEEFPTNGKVSEIIRNPVSAKGISSTDELAKIVFLEEEYNFGTVDEGKIVTHTFTFKNTGETPLLISNARATCGCTVPEWPQEPIQPGEKGDIKVRFNTANKVQDQVKVITVTANTYPSETKIRLKGFVRPGESMSNDLKAQRKKEQNQ